MRRRAIDMAKERARGTKRVGHRLPRASMRSPHGCKWKHRYYWQSMEMLSFISRQEPSHSNVARYVDVLVELGYLVDIHVPSETGGRHKRYLTVVCTAADRTGQTLDGHCLGSEDNQGSRSRREIRTRLSANDDCTSNLSPGNRELPGLGQYVILTLCPTTRESNT